MWSVRKRSGGKVCFSFSSCWTTRNGLSRPRPYVPYCRVKHHPFRHCRSRFFAIGILPTCTASLCVAHSAAAHCCTVVLARMCALLRYTDSVHGSLYRNCSASGTMVCNTLYKTQCALTVVCYWNVLRPSVSGSHVHARDNMVYVHVQCKISEFTQSWSHICSMITPFCPIAGRVFIIKSSIN